MCEGRPAVATCKPSQKLHDVFPTKAVEKGWIPRLPRTQVDYNILQGEANLVKSNIDHIDQVLVLTSKPKLTSLQVI